MRSAGPGPRTPAPGIGHGRDAGVAEPMTPDRWQRIGDLLLDALDVPEPERHAFVARESAGDAGLRAEVESLLEAHATSGPADRLANTLGAHLIEDLLDGAGLEGGTVRLYEIGERIERGGMSVVYRAWDPKLERHVALKFLPGRVSSDAARRRRLFTEAQMAAGLEHTNICTIYEIGEAEDGQLFMAMPLYDGETLRARLERGPLVETEAVRLAIQAARGLARAHGRGVIHRDIKPGNLMITEDGALKILDFGIAQMEGAAQPSARTPGTSYYMSPEQVEGRPVEARSDLWSLGVVLYEMLAGRRPFEGPTSQAVRDSVTRDAPAPLTTMLPRISPGLDSVVHALLQKDPARRPGSAADVVEALRDVERRTRRQRPARRVFVIVAGTALIGAVLTALGPSVLEIPAPGVTSVAPENGGSSAVAPLPGAGPQRAAIPSVSPAGLAAYDRGRYLRSRWEPGDGEASIEALARAVELEPQWAAAHAELASAYHFLASGSPEPRRSEYYRHAKAAALEAIRLDETLAGGHAALAFVLLMYDFDFAGAEPAFRRALELTTDESEYRWGWALFELAAARYDEAIVDFRRALSGAPFSPSLHYQLAHALGCAGRYEEAFAIADQFDDDDTRLMSFAGTILLRLDREERGVARVENAVALSDSGTISLAALAHAYAFVGRGPEARALIPELEARGAWIPEVYAALGEPLRVLDELRRGYDERRSALLFARCRAAAAFTDLTTLDGLAEHPRMLDLMRAIGFPD